MRKSIIIKDELILLLVGYRCRYSAVFRVKFECNAIAFEKTILTEIQSDIYVLLFSNLGINLIVPKLYDIYKVHI